VYERVMKNPVKTLAIKKKISTELFIERTAFLYSGETWIRVMTNEGDQQVGTS